MASPSRRPAFSRPLRMSSPCPSPVSRSVLSPSSTSSMIEARLGTVTRVRSPSSWARIASALPERSQVRLEGAEQRQADGAEVDLLRLVAHHGELAAELPVQRDLQLLGADPPGQLDALA